MTSDPNHDPESAPSAAAEQVSLVLELLWGAGERRGRGPKPGLTLDQVIGTAIAIADTDGLDALSMRRVARELRVGTMSLYRYVPGKAELLDLMFDAVSDCGKEIARSQGKDWRGMLEVVARGTRDRFLAHPWLLQVNWARPTVGPNSLAGFEFVLSGLDGLGLTDRERVAIVVTIDGFVTGLARSRLQHSAVIEETGLSDEEFWTQHSPVLERAMASGAFPALAGLSEDSFGMSWDDNFEFGLQRLLDGIEALIEARRDHASARAASR